MDEPKELDEKDFIQESYGKDPMSFWVWLAVFIAFVLCFWGIGSWYYRTMSVQLEQSPFLQVTNREMSIFLWQFSDKMPQHVKEKTGYLPGFDYQNRIGIKPNLAEKYVVAPPELLFLYHTWSRLLKDEFTPRPIPSSEFQEFLNLQPEWMPEMWVAAPEGYKALVRDFSQLGSTNLATLPESTLPQMVRMAFQGWKNYYLERDFINLATIKYGELSMFVDTHPDYARNFWRNIYDKDLPLYLKTLTFDKYDPKARVSDEEMAPFLKVAVYNFLKAEKEE